MPYKEEEDRVCEVKCPKGGGVCVNWSTTILLPTFSYKANTFSYKANSFSYVPNNFFYSAHNFSDKAYNFQQVE